MKSAITVVNVDNVDKSLDFENPLDFAKKYKKQIVKSKTNVDNPLEFAKQYQK